MESVSYVAVPGVLVGLSALLALLTVVERRFFDGSGPQ
jgi:hypothetical protein